MASSDSLSPTDEIGGASSQSSECGADAAKSLALSTSDDALERTLVTRLLTIRPSQAFEYFVVRQPVSELQTSPTIEFHFL